MKQMAFAVKTNTEVRAWELGKGSDMEKEMLRCGKIVARPDGTYELFSQEATQGKGQVAKAGDFFKVDDLGFPYPNERRYFLENHTHLKEDWYKQTAKPLKIWRLGDPECEELRYLLDHGILSVYPEDPEHCFSASLWNTIETAASDAVIVFFDVKKKDGIIDEVNFNFVDAKYFSKYYRVIPS